jgi:regulator of cell morphogenesis and NO signaling
MSYLNWPVGHIAAKVPGATSIFFKQKINFCCDSGRLLSEVLEHKKLDQQQVLSELFQLENKSTKVPDFESKSNKEVIEHILKRYHDVHKTQFTELKRLSQRVETVHAKHPLCPTGLTEHLESMESELLQHMEKEEAILFPLIAKGFSPITRGPINVMRLEHEDHLMQINKIYELTNDVIAHDKACTTWQALYIGLQDFISDLIQHIHTENNVLFNRVSA